MTLAHNDQSIQTPQIFRHEFTKFVEVESFLEKNHDSVRIQPTGARLQVSTTLLLLGDLRIWTSTVGSDYEIIGGERPKRYWICLPSRGTTEARFGSKAERISGGQGWVRDSETLESIRRYEGYIETSFDIPHEIVRNHLARALEYEPASAIRLDGMIDVSHGNGRLLSTLITAMIVGVDNGTALSFSPFSARNFSNLVLDVLVHGLMLQPADTAHGNYSRTIGRAIDFIEANLQRSLTIMDIAEAAGVGPRALQIGFQRQFGRSPLKYARQLRLARARDDLLTRADHESIGDIATRWGFFHLGQFARQYRETYGERPSETKRI